MPVDIQVASDLHLNFAPLTLPGGELLILAGDVMEAGHIRLYHNQDKHQREHFNYVKFCQEELTKYDHVIYVFGNHEYWGSSIEEAQTWIQTLLPPNTTILDGEATSYRGIPIWGGTLWTHQANPLQQVQSKMGMVDYQAIKTKTPINGRWTSKLTPEHTHRLHQDQVKNLQTWLAGTQHPNIVVTHHSPQPDPWGSSLGHCYYTDLTPTIHHRGPAWWIWGHTHQAHQSKMHRTHLVSNPRGYHPYEHTAHNWQPHQFQI